MPGQSASIPVQLAISDPDRFPFEILSHIFQLAAPRSLISHPDFNAHQTDPSTLAQVCQHWRNVAIGQQRLWTNIFLALNLPDEVSHEFDVEKFCVRMMRRLRDSLMRSVPWTLDVVIAKVCSQRNPKSPPPPAFLAFTSQALHTIATFSSHIGRLNIKLEPRTYHAFGPGAMVVSWDRLQTLTLSSGGRGLSFDFADARSLRKVKTPIDVLQYVSLPWSTLTCLSIDCPPNTYNQGFLFEVLEKCSPGVEELEMLFPVVILENIPHPPPPVTISRLRVLTISFPIAAAGGVVGSPTGLDVLLNRVTCPQLRTFRIAGGKPLDILNFIRSHTGNSLHTLSLGTGVLTNMSPVPISDVFTFTPNLRQLVLCGVPPRHPVLQALLSTVILPRLERLVLYFFGNRAHSVDVIEAIVEARWRNGSLQALIVDADCTPRLDALRAEGLIVRTPGQQEAAEWPERVDGYLCRVVNEGGRR